MAAAAEKKELHYKRGAIMARLTRMSTFLHQFDKINGNYFELSVRFDKMDFSYTEFEQIQEKIEFLEPENEDHDDNNKREEFDTIFYDLKSKFHQVISEKSFKNSVKESDVQSEIMEEKNKRSAVCGRLSRLEKFFDSFDKVEGDFQQLHGRFEMLDLCFSEFDSIQTQIEFIEKDKTEENIEVRTTFENKFFELKSQVHRIFMENSDKYLCESKLKFSSQQPRQIKQEFSSIQLPTLNIPTFCGDYESWLSFHDIFVSLIHNNNSLSTIQKFYYLKSSLRNDAESLVQSLEITNENYPLAWGLLKERYENKKLIVRKHVQALFDIPKVEKESASSLRNLIDCTSKNLRVLNQLGELTDQWDTLIVFMISNNFDLATRRDWESSTNAKDGKKPTVADITAFIHLRCQILESIESNDCSKSKSATSAHSYSKPSTTLYRTSSNFNQKSISKSDVSDQHKQSSESRNSASTFHSVDSNHQFKSQVILATAMVKVVDYNGKTVLCRAVLDSASHSNFMTEELAKRLKLKYKPIAKDVGGISDSHTNITSKVTTNVKSRFTGFNSRLDFCLLNRITNRLPIQAIDIKNWNIPGNINLADPKFDIPNKVDLLIGAEIFLDMLYVGQIKLSDDLPRLQKTTFGWIVSGKIKSHNTDESVHDVNCFNYFTSDVCAQVTKTWNQEEVISDPLAEKVSSDQLFTQEETHFNDNLSRVNFQKENCLFGDPTSLQQSYEVVLIQKWKSHVRSKWKGRKSKFPIAADDVNS